MDFSIEYQIRLIKYKIPIYNFFRFFIQEKLESKTKSKLRAMTYREMKLYANELGVEVPMGCTKSNLAARIEEQIRLQKNLNTLGRSYLPSSRPLVQRWARPLRPRTCEPRRATGRKQGRAGKLVLIFRNIMFRSLILVSKKTSCFPKKCDNVFSNFDFFW